MPSYFPVGKKCIPLNSWLSRTEEKLPGAGSTEIDLVFQMDEESVLGMLSNLTVEEQAIIRPVLERDLEFQRREKLRLQELRETVVERKQSLLSSKSQESFASSISTSVRYILSSHLSEYTSFQSVLPIFPRLFHVRHQAGIPPPHRWQMPQM